MKKWLKNIIIFMLCFLVIFYIASHLYNYYFSKPLEIIFHRNKDDLQKCLQIKRNDRVKTVRILVVSGGGVNGVIPLAYLRYFEEKTKKPTSQLFDFFVGTSTGSIIVSILNAPNANGKIMTANELYYNYLNLSKNVLYSSLWRKIFTINGLFGPKLSIHRMYKSFSKNPHATDKFYKLKNHVAITNYHIEKLKIAFLKNWDCQNIRVYSSVAEVLTSAAALPLVFSPVVFKGQKSTKETYIDGALLANRPYLQAIRMVKRLYPNAENYVVVSLGTGEHSVKEYHLEHQSLQYWGILKWLEPIIKIFFYSQQYESYEGITDLISFVPKEKFKYYYLSSNWNMDPFNVDTKNLQALNINAQTAVKKNQKVLDEVIHLINSK